MKPYFASSASQAILRFHASEWLGTPFAKRAMVRGGGTDCVHLVAAIYIASGFMTEFKPPQYALDSGHHRANSQLTAWLDKDPRFLRLEPGHAAQAGDALCFNLGLSEHHAALMIGGRTGLEFIHVMPRRTVSISSLAERYFSRRVTAIYRPMEGRVG